MKTKGSHIYADNEPALVLQARRPPDRRQISVRWLAGTFLTGLTSCSLMGIALFTALHGREQLAVPPELMSGADMAQGDYGDSGDEKSPRLIPTRPLHSADDRRRFELSTMQKVDGKEVIRSQAFEMVDMSLAEEHSQQYSYPKFNPLKLFADAPQPAAAESPAQIYGAKVESDVTMQTVDYPMGDDVIYGTADVISGAQAEALAQASVANFSDSGDTLDALRNMNPQRLPGYVPLELSELPDVKITQENVSVLSAAPPRETADNYAEDIIPAPRNEAILSALERAGYPEDNSRRISDALSRYNDDDDELPAGSVLRLGVQADRYGQNQIVRASIYEDKRHVISVAMNDDGAYVRCNEPEMTPVMRTTLEGRTPVIRVAADRLPTVYDAVWQSALAYHMTPDMAKQLIRVLANDVDLQSRISPNDSLSVFYPLPSEGDTNPDREILYIKADFDGEVSRYYRFQTENGTVDYYNEDGRSSRPFLLRKPVPNARMSSPFGARRHPVLGYVRMHMGVDWAAPRGSPILAAGDGTVTKAGWMNGYGNHTEIRHANGYMTSYSHQSAFAPGIRVGAHVRQGQIIGYIGSTGLSTGPHCHFEMVINGVKVDPMRVRLPDSKSLHGEQLEAFERERDKIDSLMNSSTGSITRIASAAPAQQ